MDAVKSADSVDFFALKPAQKPQNGSASPAAAHPRQSSPSSFAALLKKTSQKAKPAPESAAKVPLAEEPSPFSDTAKLRSAGFPQKESASESLEIAPGSKPTDDDGEIPATVPSPSATPVEYSNITVDQSLEQGQFSAVESELGSIPENKPSVVNSPSRQIDRLPAEVESTSGPTDKNPSLDNHQPEEPLLDLASNPGERVPPQKQEHSATAAEPGVEFSFDGVSQAEPLAEPLSQLPDTEIIDPVDLPIPEGKPRPNAATNPHSHAEDAVFSNPHPLQNFSPNPTVLEHSDAVNRLSSIPELAIPWADDGSSPSSAAGLEESNIVPSETTLETLKAQPEKPTDGPTSLWNPSGPSPVLNRADGNADASIPSVNPLGGDQSQLGEPEALVDRIGSSVMQAANGGKVLRMRLHPPELGVLQIEVTSLEGTVTARLDVENAKAHHAIRENLSQLQEMLHKTHANIDRIELNILDSQAGPGNSSRQSGGNTSNSNEPPLPANGPQGNQDADSGVESNSLGNAKQRQDWGSPSLSLTGIDIQA